MAGLFPRLTELIRTRPPSSVFEFGPALSNLAPIITGNLNSNAKTLAEEWAALGLEIREISIPMSGAAVTSGKRPVIFVKKDDDKWRKRFTVAHELGHLLIDSLIVPVKRPKNIEEKICNKFASQVLVPKHELLAYLRIHGNPDSPHDVLRMCVHFRVTISAIIIAIGECPSRSDKGIIGSRLRGHPARPGEIDFRIEYSAPPDNIYLPRHQRIKSLGFTNLARVAEQLRDYPATPLFGVPDPASSNTSLEGQGVDIGVQLEVRAKNRSGIAVCDARWKARCLGKESNSLIAVFSIENVQVTWRCTSRQRPSADETSEIATGLTHRT